VTWKARSEVTNMTHDVHEANAETQYELQHSDSLSQEAAKEQMDQGDS